MRVARCGKRVAERIQPDLHDVFEMLFLSVVGSISTRIAIDKRLARTATDVVETEIGRQIVECSADYREYPFRGVQECQVFGGMVEQQPGEGYDL